jgi:hypothetical protein
VKRDEPNNPLNRFRRRAAGDPFFLGYALGRFAADRKLGYRELAEFLGCAVDRLPHLMACRSPDPVSARFGSDVAMIAQFTGCTEERLLAALREVSVLGVLRGLPSIDVREPGHASLLAARQRPTDPSDETGRGQNNDGPRGT